ncbi:hypothetical protein J7K03_01580 [bacterium]|nr:hypothetical protein [bacterium]
MKFFSHYNEKEKALLELYSRLFTMNGIPNAHDIAKKILDQAIEKSKREGTYNLPPNFGDILLGRQKPENSIVERKAEMVRKTLPQKIKEGVREEDIRWWWNLNDVERQMMLGVDDFYRLTFFINQIKSGKTAEEAGKAIWKAHPIYTDGDPNVKPKQSPIELKREDFPLPVELKDRVNRYIKKRTNDDPEKIQVELKKFSTFNAFIRKEIKAGKI